VSAVVTNTGTATATQSITFSINGDVLRNVSGTLAGGESAGVTFDNVDTSSVPAGDNSYTVSTDGSELTGTLTIESAQFDVHDLQPETVTVEQGESFDVSAAVTNRGTVAGTTSVTLSVNGDTYRQTSESLARGESTTVAFDDIGTSLADVGDNSYTVSTQDSEVAGTLTVTSNDNDGDSGLDRFDQDGDGRFGFREVITAIGAYNSDTPIGGQEVTFTDVINLIAEHNNPSGKSTQSTLERFDQDGNSEFSFDEVLAAIEAHDKGTTIGDSEVTFDDVLAVIAAHDSS